MALSNLMAAVIAVSLSAGFAFGGDNSVGCNLEEAKKSVAPRIRFGSELKVPVETDTEKLAAQGRPPRYTWEKFKKEKYRPGDCVVAFDTKDDPQAPLSGAATGFLLIRGSVVIDEIITYIK